MKKQSIDIKSLTSELKGLQQGKNQSSQGNERDHNSRKLYGNRSTPSKKSDRVDQEATANIATDKLHQIIREVNAKEHYKVDRIFYVDEDIHELFIQLKSQTRLKISHLVSSLLEDFIMEHRKAIREIISRKQNKFLE